MGTSTSGTPSYKDRRKIQAEIWKTLKIIWRITSYVLSLAAILGMVLGWPEGLMFLIHFVELFGHVVQATCWFYRRLKARDSA